MENENTDNEGFVNDEQSDTPEITEQPDYLLPKFRTIEDQAKAYSEAERKMTQATEEAKQYKELVALYNQNLPQQVPNQNQEPRVTTNFYEDPEKWAKEQRQMIMQEVGVAINQVAQTIEYRVGNNLVIEDFLMKNPEFQPDENQALLAHYAKVVDPNFQMTSRKRLEEAAKKTREYLGGVKEEARSTRVSPRGSGIPASKTGPGTSNHTPNTPKISDEEDWIKFRAQYQQNRQRVDSLPIKK
jgi:hypothetical protein